MRIVFVKMIENVVNHSEDLDEISTKVLFSEPIG
jgi:hypothetical protein